MRCSRREVRGSGWRGQRVQGGGHEVQPVSGGDVVGRGGQRARLGGAGTPGGAGRCWELREVWRAVCFGASLVYEPNLARRETKGGPPNTA